MPASGTPLKRLGFLTIGTFDPADPAVQAADELAIALPAGLPAGDLARILTAVAERLGPALGWSPAA